MAKRPSTKGATAPATKPTAEAKAPANAAPQQEAQPEAKPEKAKRPPAIVQHGVSRPRAGGLCAAVWELTEAGMSHNNATGDADFPSIAEVKAKAAEQGLNPTNVSIEYYRCRQFHGVRGRQAKKPAEAEAQQ